VNSDEVRNAVFRDKFRGYHPDDVDQLLAEVASEMDAGRSVSSLVRAPRFRSKLRGYHPSDVDALLAKLSRN
jgi:DivIVA domain-containing protein